MDKHSKPIVVDKEATIETSSAEQIGRIARKMEHERQWKQRVGSLRALFVLLLTTVVGTVSIPNPTTNPGHSDKAVPTKSPAKPSDKPKQHGEIPFRPGRVGERHEWPAPDIEIPFQYRGEEEMPVKLPPK